MSSSSSTNNKSTAADVADSAGLIPIADPVPFVSCSMLISVVTTILLIPLYIAGALVFLVVFLLLTVTGIGPLVEFCMARSDQTALDRETILQEHPELFLIEIPHHINRASLGQPYKVMVRLTMQQSRTSEESQQQDFLPPVIFPGGLASNLMTMSRHQDILTEQYGFTVVNFDRLGVGLSDPFPEDAAEPLVSPSAADVAREMEYVMTHCASVAIAARSNNNNTNNNKTNRPLKWIQVGGSMGTNVATAFVALFPGRLCGFFNLDGLPHAFIQIQCKKFLQDGKWGMDLLKSLQFTGLPRLVFRMAVKPLLPAMGTAFTPQQIIGVMCRKQFFTATGLEYATLMSCCDLEIAAWGPHLATTEYDAETLRVMASVAPTQSVLVDELKGIQRRVTNERSASELGTEFLSRDHPSVVGVQTKLRSMALKSPNEVDKIKTHCNWPDPNPRHPVGEFVGGVDENTTIYPLAVEFSKLCVRVMCARDYKGFERDYTQAARNHAAARTSLHVMMSSGGGDDSVDVGGRSYYYPHLSHLNLWQQAQEVADITNEMAQAIKRADLA